MAATGQRFLISLIILLFCSRVLAQSRWVEVQLGAHKLKVELADTPELRGKGLMFRDKLPAEQGMLFVFEKPEPVAFWMKNTFIPLSIGFFDSSLRLFKVVENMEPAQSMVEVLPKRYESGKPSAIALEVNRGWFERKKIRPGQMQLKVISPVPKDSLLHRYLQ